MKGLFYSAWEELGRMYRAMGGNPAFLILEIALFALNARNMVKNSGMLWGTFVIFILPVAWGLYALLRWLSGGEIVLERSAGRAPWSTMGGKALAWLVCLSAAEALRQLVTWQGAIKDPERISWALRNGEKIFTLEDAAPALGWKPYLVIVSACLLLLMSFTLMYFIMRGEKGHRLCAGERTMAALLLCSILIIPWYLGLLPPWPILPILVPPVLWLCCLALEFWEN